MGKSWYTSKTLWVNFIAFIALLIQTYTGLVMDAEIQLGILAFINFVLRLITKQEVDWKKPPSTPLLVMLLCISLVAAAACAGTQGTSTGKTPADTAAQWDQTAVKVYKLTGLTIQTAQGLLPAAKPFLPPSDYAAYDNLLNVTVPPVYDAVGLALQAVIGVTDTAERQGAIAAYEAALAQLNPLMTKVSEAISAIQASKEK